jgi:probable HAF family extracellular repeat protein
LSTVARGINDAGDIVGTFSDATGSHGFLLTGGVFTTIDAVPPFAPPPPQLGAGTDAFGINDAGQIVGSFNDATGFHGFLLTGGVFTTIDAPGSTTPLPFTQIFGINDAGQIVGRFSDATFVDHGFLATPAAVPEAGTLVLVTSGLLALGAARVRSRPRQDR